MLSGMNDELGVVPRRGADDRLGDGFRASYEREAFPESFEGNIRCFLESPAVSKIEKVLRNLH